MLNVLTIDVEDYFQVTAFEKYVNFEDWDTYPSGFKKINGVRFHSSSMLMGIFLKSRSNS